MVLTTQPYKGSRDFYPEDKRLQKYIFAKLRSAVERFGYEEYDAPILEPLELYLAKTSEEIVSQQTYGFKDRGGRQLVIRPEMTPTVSRMVAARRQQLYYPIRWYSIPNLWRYERPQRGRLREHWQLNVDLFGITDNQAEYEIINLIDEIFKSFGAKHSMYSIHLNSRLLVNYMFQKYLGLNQQQSTEVSKLVDRFNKMERSEFVTLADALINSEQRESGVLEKLLDLLSIKKVSDLPTDLQKLPAVENLRNLMTMLEASGINNVIFDTTIMRGFDYYTDLVFEVFDSSPDNNRSMMGGGRYDSLVGLFGVEPIATIGFGLGDITLQNFLSDNNLLPDLPVEMELCVILIGDVFIAAQPFINQLRSNGLNVVLAAPNKKLGDNLKTADRKGIDNVMLIGAQELKDQKFRLKNLKSGSEEKHSLHQITAIIKNYRQT